MGYKGIIGDKLSAAVDFYTYERQGFTHHCYSPAFVYTLILHLMDAATGISAATPLISVVEGALPAKEIQHQLLKVRQQQLLLS